MFKVAIIFDNVTTANLNKVCQYLKNSGVEDYRIENGKQTTITYEACEFEVSADDVIEYNTEYLKNNNIPYCDVQCYE